MRTMKNNLVKKVLDSLASHLKPLGFSLVRGRRWFVRFNGNRTEKFQLAFLDAKPGNRILPAVSIRFDEVEDIFHRTSGYEPEYQSDTPTVGVDLWRVFGEQGFDLLLRDEGEIPGVVSRLMTIFNEKALPYFSQFGDIAAVDSALNDNPDQPSMHAGALPWLRASKGRNYRQADGSQQL